MNLLPRSFATLALAVSAVPGVAPLAAHVHVHHHPAAHHAARTGHHGKHPGAHPNGRPKPHAPGHPAGHARRRFMGAALVAEKASSPAPEPTTGGWTVQNPASPEVLDAATFAVVSLSQTFGGHYVVEDVKQARTQVVYGTNFQLKLRIAELQDEILGARKDCTVVVWSRPFFRPADKLTSYDCQSVDAAVPAAPAAPAAARV